MSELKWIKHDGGPMPVPGDTAVETRYRGETMDDCIKNAMDAGGYNEDQWYWRRHSYGECDIVEYAIVNPSPSATSPTHYQSGGMECIDAIRAALTPDEFRGYCKGNMLKYAWRERNKGGDDDLRKAAVYAGFATEQTDG